MKSNLIILTISVLLAGNFAKAGGEMWSSSRSKNTLEEFLSTGFLERLRHLELTLDEPLNSLDEPLNSKAHPFLTYPNKTVIAKNKLGTNIVEFMGLEVGDKVIKCEIAGESLIGSKSQGETISYNLFSRAEVINSSKGLTVLKIENPDGHKIMSCTHRTLNKNGKPIALASEVELMASELRKYFEILPMGPKDSSSECLGGESKLFAEILANPPQEIKKKSSSYSCSSVFIKETQAHFSVRQLKELPDMKMLFPADSNGEFLSHNKNHLNTSEIVLQKLESMKNGVKRVLENKQEGQN